MNKKKLTFSQKDIEKSPCHYFPEFCPYKNNDDDMCIICISDTIKQLKSILSLIKRGYEK